MKKIKGALEYVADIIPSPEEIRDEIGNLISMFICGPERFENREELRRRVTALKDSLAGKVDTDSVINDVVRALDKLEAIADEVICGVEKNLKKVSLLTISLVFALGAVLLDRHWRSFFNIQLRKYDTKGF